MVNGNGYKVAFWVMATIATVGIVMLTNAIVSNDKTREIGDRLIVDAAILRDETLSDKFSILQTQANDCIHRIDLRLSRIETKMGIDISGR